MKLSDGVEWGVHACVVLAVLPPDAALPAARLAEYHGVPSAYLAKHLQALARAGVLETVKGPRGGYRLARPATDITVLDVVEAIDGDEPAFRCTEIRRRGPSAVPRASTACRAASTARSPAPTRRGEPSSRRRTSPISWWEWCRKHRAPRSKKPPAGSAKPSADPKAPTGVSSGSQGPVSHASSSGLAAGAGALAVVGLVAAGLDLALLGLLAHEGSHAIPSVACAPMDNLGLVGFTGAGANRLFSALTGLPAPSEYEAAVGVASLPDERLDLLAAMSASKKVVQAGFELVHIALPPVPSRVRVSGGKVLGSLRNCDAILVVLRAFDDGGVDADPAGDLDALELELVMTDLASVEQRLNKQRRAAKSGDKEIVAEVGALERAFAALEGGTPLSTAGLSDDDLTRIAPVFCLTTKPSLVVLNTGEKVDADAAAAIPGATAVPIDIEAEIAACAPEDRAEMREMYGVGESALTTVAHAAYHLLGRRTFLTTGEDESRAWTFRAVRKRPSARA